MNLIIAALGLSIYLFVSFINVFLIRFPIIPLASVTQWRSRVIFSRRLDIHIDAKRICKYPRYFYF